jgi:hypothetical protein
LKTGTYEALNLEVAAVIRGHIALAQLANGDDVACAVFIAAFTSLLETSPESIHRSSWMAYLPIARRIAGDLAKSLDYC